ncbi:MAG: TonB-dependent receptor [Myxococcales bacterium]|nr:TonB-dependent receptor [Myxococcales bacterium]
MARARSLVLGWLLAAVTSRPPGTAAAEEGRADGAAAAGDDADAAAPAIPIRDLPPFPDLTSEAEKVSEVSVLGAILAEEETVVGAAKREQSLGSVASAVTVITADQVRRFGYRTVAEVLRGVAGLFVVDDRSVERVGVRGIQLLGDANTRLLILLDGSPLNEPWSQFVDSSTALPVSLDDVARIEIIRGPVSSIYGTNAFLGIINIVTIEADKAPRAAGHVTVDSYGTVGGNASFNQGDINRQVRGSAGYTYRAGETITYPDFTAAGLPDRTSADGAYAAFGAIAVNFDRVFFQARGYDRLREQPGAPYQSEIGSDRNRNRDTHLLAELGYTRELTDRVTLAARLYGNRYRFDSDLVRFDGPFSTTATSLWYGGEVRVLADLAATPELLALTAGASLERTTTESTATAKLTPIDHDFNIAGAYLEASTTPYPWLAATAGLRFDRNSEFSNKLSPRAALFLRRGKDAGLKLLYAQGFRNPSIFEAYYDDDTRFAPALDDAGRTELRPETITSYEAVAYGKLAAGVKVRLSLWEWHLADLLKRFEVFDPEDVAPRLAYQNTARLVSRGAEVEATYRDVAGRFLYGNAALAFTGRNCVVDDGIGNLTLDPDAGNCDPRLNAPVLVAKGGASSRLLWRRFYVSTELSVVSGRGTQDPDVVLPTYVGWNVVAFAPAIGGFDVTVGARNLLGRERVAAQSDYNRSDPRFLVLEIPGPGRELFVRAGRRF